MSKKASDKVKHPQIWPHSVLQYEFVSENVKFKDFDLKMFVAGELEILMTKISKSEFKGRMRFLKKIVYFASLYDWKRLLQYYAAWFRRIEMGMNSWHDDPSVIESATLLSKSYIRKPGTESVSKPDQVWWCADFNNNKCTMQSAHNKNLSGRVRFVQHICSACWKADKKNGYSILKILRLVRISTDFQMCW